MLRTKSIVSSIADVPREWVFEYYLKLNTRLNGQDVKIKSPFNMTEKNPSFFVYYGRNSSHYMFKDFSTGNQGDGAALVLLLFNLSTRGEAAHKIISDYNNYLSADPNGARVINFTVEDKFKVTKFTARHWNNIDVKFWTSFKIGSDVLSYYNVQPLDNYTLSKTLPNGELKTLLMDNALMYGYFRADGTLYKIYQPYVKDNKFIKVIEHIQGTDQLTFKVPYLVICSSLKDMMSFKSLKLKNAETVAPDSENILIPEHIINAYKSKYTNICTLFDNDKAGISSMKKYEKKFRLPYVRLELEKDVSDGIKVHGISNTRIHLFPLLTKALTGVTKQI